MSFAPPAPPLGAAVDPAAPELGATLLEPASAVGVLLAAAPAPARLGDVDVVAVAGLPAVPVDIAGAEVRASGSSFVGESATSVPASEPHAARASNITMLSVSFRIALHYAQSSGKVEDSRDSAYHASCA